RRQEEPRLLERHDARLGADRHAAGLQVREPEREDELRLRTLLHRLILGHEDLGHEDLGHPRLKPGAGKSLILDHDKPAFAGSLSCWTPSKFWASRDDSTSTCARLKRRIASCRVRFIRTSTRP